MKSICHITPEHFRYDTRIFLKECTSLAKAGYKVNLIVCDGKGDEIKNKVAIIDIGKKNYSTLQKQIIGGYKAMKKAWSLNADIYHFHDHSFIMPAFFLLLKKKKVILDAHEDSPAEILNRTTQKRWKKIISYSIYKLLDVVMPRYYTAIITATTSIKEKFEKKNQLTVEVRNYPILEELRSPAKVEKKNQICYIGGIFKIRGIIELITALEMVDTTLVLAGRFEDEELERLCRSLKGWEKVDYRGFLDRKELANVLAASKAGIVTFLPGPNHNNAQPNKMYEYMSAGLPIIASHFPLWKELIEGNECGLCVDPANPTEIAEAIKYMITNPLEALEMGQNGFKAVVEKYNWAAEEQQLLNLYDSVLEK